MLKASDTIAYMDNGKSFDDYRGVVTEAFFETPAFCKRKLTQGLYWSSLEKDLANQMYRDERWFLGIKYKDELRLVDHGSTEADNKKSVGFNSKK